MLLCLILKKHHPSSGYVHAKMQLQPNQQYLAFARIVFNRTAIAQKHQKKMTFFKSKSFGCCSSTQEDDDDEDKGISAEFVITRRTARLDSSTYHPPTQKR